MDGTEGQEKPTASPICPNRQDVIKVLSLIAEQWQMPVSESSIRNVVVGAGERIQLEEFFATAEKLGIKVTQFAGESIADIDASRFPVLMVSGHGECSLISERIADSLYSVISAKPDAELEQRHIDSSAEEQVAFFYFEQVTDRQYRSSENARPSHWFWSAISDNRWIYTQVLLAAAVTNILGLSTALFIMVVYDRVVPNQAMESLLALTIGIGIALIFDFIIKTLRGVFIERAGQKADIRMGRKIFDHILDMKIGARKGSSGGMANTLREFETLRDFFASASVAAVIDLPFIFLFIGIIYLIGGPLFIVPLLAVPFVFLVGLAVQPILARVSQEAFDEGRSKQGVLVEALNGLETIKVTGAAPVVRQRWEESIRNHSHISKRGRIVQQLALNATAFAQQLAQVAIVVYGVFLIGDGVISMGAMIAAVILTGRTLAPLAQLAQTLTRINQAKTAYRAIDKLMALPAEHPEGRRYLSRPNLRGRLVLQEVSFSYPDESTPALRDINVVIEPGERVAILGKVGSGKSTLANLILGMYQPSVGHVLFDGADVRQIDPLDLRRNIGAVLQDVWLFSGTVRDNIAIGSELPRDEDILHASQLAGAEEFLAKHPLGYDMLVGERGVGLSGGQRQLIALARALLSKPSLLLLDEFTSAMDVQTEQRIIKRLSEQLQDQTIILITHRTSLLQLVDRVIVLDNGSVVADGPKEDIFSKLKKSA